jgi:hypothetical protein
MKCRLDWIVSALGMLALLLADVPIIHSPTALGNPAITLPPLAYCIGQPCNHFTS